ncbi:hypothetical protein MKEN_01246300 [Mycena kentingensis (nom. inval.)]|nr:hypothetical protein MKEN_01246300 [Mycena kentingensis (nom. inval.)]
MLLPRSQISDDGIRLVLLIGGVLVTIALVVGGVELWIRFAHKRALGRESLASRAQARKVASDTLRNLEGGVGVVTPFPVPDPPPASILKHLASWAQFVPAINVSRRAATETAAQAVGDGPSRQPTASTTERMYISNQTRRAQMKALDIEGHSRNASVASVITDTTIAEVESRRAPDGTETAFALEWSMMRDQLLAALGNIEELRERIRQLERQGTAGVTG